MKKLILLLLPLFFILSCSVQKRKYQKGYYVNWSKNKENTRKQTVSTSSKKADIKFDDINTVVVESAMAERPKKEEVTGNFKTLYSKPKVKPANTDSCSKILFQNGDEVSAKIIEISGTEVKYKKCDLADGPLYVSRKSDIFMITYPNGMKEKFSNSSGGSDKPSKGNSYNSGKSNSPQKKDRENAMFSLILGITGLILYFGSIPAIVMGINALKDIKREPDKYGGEGMAIAGIALGIFKLVLVVLVIMLLVLLI